MKDQDKVRLVLLFALRYEKDGTGRARGTATRQLLPRQPCLGLHACRMGLTMPA